MERKYHCDDNKQYYYISPNNDKIYVSSVEVIIDYLSEGNDINKPYESGATPLTIAALEGDIPLIEFLIERGANIFVKERSMFGTFTAVGSALEAGQIETAKYLTKILYRKMKEYKKIKK